MAKAPKQRIVRPEEEDEEKIKREAAEKSRRRAAQKAGQSANKVADVSAFGSATSVRAGLRSSFG